MDCVVHKLFQSHFPLELVLNKNYIRHAKRVPCHNDKHLILYIIKKYISIFSSILYLKLFDITSLVRISQCLPFCVYGESIYNTILRLSLCTYGETLHCIACYCVSIYTYIAVILSNGIKGLSLFVIE
jgi:hypothetical protein